MAIFALKQSSKMLPTKCLLLTNPEKIQKRKLRTSNSSGNNRAASPRRSRRKSSSMGAVVLFSIIIIAAGGGAFWWKSLETQNVQVSGSGASLGTDIVALDSPVVHNNTSTDFSQVKTIFEEKLWCHGAERQKGRFRMDTLAGVMKGGNSG